MQIVVTVTRNSPRTNTICWLPNIPNFTAILDCYCTYQMLWLLDNKQVVVTWTCFVIFAARRRTFVYKLDGIRSKTLRNSDNDRYGYEMFTLPLSIFMPIVSVVNAPINVILLLSFMLFFNKSSMLNGMRSIWSLLKRHEWCIKLSWFALVSCILNKLPSSDGMIRMYELSSL